MQDNEIKRNISKRDFLKLTELTAKLIFIDIVRGGDVSKTAINWLMNMYYKDVFLTRFPQFNNKVLFSHDLESLRNKNLKIQKVVNTSNLNINPNNIKYIDRDSKTVCNEDISYWQWNHEGKLCKMLRIKIQDTDDYSLYMNVWTDGKLQSFPFIQGGLKERGDVSFLISGKNGFTPSGIVFDLEHNKEMNNLDMIHILSWKIGRGGPALTEDKILDNNYYSNSPGSIFPIDIDLLRHDQPMDIYHDIPKLGPFINTLFANAHVIGHH